MNRHESPAVDDPLPPLAAPHRLTSDHRLEFRRAALEALDAAVRRGQAEVAVDLARTIEIDASGLGVLVLLQKRARERGLRTRLVGASRTVLEMLRMTQLHVLFELGAEA